MSGTPSGDGVREALRNRLIALQELGVRELRLAGRESLLAVAATSPSGVSAASAGSEASAGPTPAAGALAGSAAALEALRRDEIGDCHRCKLSGGRKTIVFGSGNPEARLMFIGEGPGADEDAQGLPFVGRAGQMLTGMIEKGMGLPRAEVYIANIVKCRPPGNRDPEPDEIAACEGFLFAQIDLIQPKVIVTLGRFATQTLLGTKSPISTLRGKFWTARGIQVMPTFHPSFLLRSYTPENRRLVWEDLLKARDALNA